MKKILLFLLLIVVLGIMVIGCGDNDISDPIENGKTTSQQSTQVADDNKDNYVNFDGISGTESDFENTNTENTTDTSASTTGDNWTNLY